MILDTTTKQLRIVLGEAHTTNPCKIVTSWATTSANSWAGGNTNINSNGTTPVVVVGSPAAAGIVVDVHEVRLFNADTVPHTVTLQLYDGTNVWQVAPALQTVPANGSFVYTPSSGVTVTQATGVTISDGTNSVASATSVSFPGATVSGSSPSATVTFPLPQEYINGLNITVASTTTFTIGTGQALSDDNTTMMSLGSSLTKSSAGTWVVGNNQNGLDTGTIANNTWYHAFLIYNPTTNTTDVLFSTSASAPSMPSGYTKKRRLGSLRTDGSAHFITIFQNGDRFDLAVPVNVVASTPIGSTTAQTATCFVPTGVVVEAINSVAMADATASGAGAYVSNLQQTDSAASVAGGTITVLGGPASATNGSAIDGLRTITNTSGQIRYRANSTTLSFWLATTGWIDHRGTS